MGGRQLFVVDVSAVMRSNFISSKNPYRGRYGRRVLTWDVDGKKFNTTALYGLLRLFTMYSFDVDYVFAFDTPKNYRKQDNPDYKSNRKKMDREYFDQVDVARFMLEDVGFTTHSVEGYEADDFVVETVNRYKDVYDHIFVVTNDFDLAQLIDDNVYIKNVIQKNGDITRDNYEARLGCPYNSILLYRAMVGDKADNISGIYRFGPKSFYRFLEDEGIYGELQDLRKRRGEYEILNTAVTLNEDQRAAALASLKLIVPRLPKGYSNFDIRSNIDKDMFEFYLSRYGMNSVVKALRES